MTEGLKRRRFSPLLKYVAIYVSSAALRHTLFNMTVLDLGVGKSAAISKITAPEAAAERLRALGFTSGRVITVLGYSLFKSSVLLACGSVRLAARRSLAKGIEVAA